MRRLWWCRTIRHTLYLDTGRETLTRCARLRWHRGPHRYTKGPS